MYNKFFKRFFDFTFALFGVIALSPLFFILIILGAVKMKGNPFFTQPRPGKDEKIFKLIKFRSMSCERDKNGNLLPDEKRLNGYGRTIRALSLDELPELINILKGDMSLVGPRPQLVRDMVFMTEKQRERHSVRQGLTGLAQINGRNCVTWEEKIQYDLKYIENITFFGDIKIILATVGKVFGRSGISSEGMDTAEDLGDYLLRNNRITLWEYDLKQKESKKLIAERFCKNG